MIIIKKAFFSFVLLNFFLCFSPSPIYAKDKSDKAVEKAENKKQKQKKEQEQLEEELKKKHLKMQQEHTRKMMHRSKKESTRINKGKHPIPWYERIFQRSQKKKRKKKKT